MASKVMNIVNSLVEERKTMKEQNYIWEGEKMGWCYVVKYEANKFGARVELNNGSIVNTMDCSGDYLRSYNYWKNSNKEEELKELKEELETRKAMEKFFREKGIIGQNEYFDSKTREWKI